MSSKHFSSKLADVKSVLKKKPLVRAIALALLAGSMAIPATGWAATDCNAVTEIPVSECQSLINLYSSTNGANWKNKTGWNQSNTPCGWFGITCSGVHVTKIDLSNDGLTGQIPNLNLPELTWLGFDNNQLSGAIPNFNLPKLQALGLGGTNRLSGSIPNFNLPKLQYLSLDNNQLSGLIPSFTLPELIGLQLNGNKLSGSIPNFNSPSLQALLLSNNSLNGSIPNFTAFSLSKLYVATFNNNCGLTAYDTAQKTVLDTKDPSWQQKNPLCPAIWNSVDVKGDLTLISSGLLQSLLSQQLQNSSVLNGQPLMLNIDGNFVVKQNVALEVSIPLHIKAKKISLEVGSSISIPGKELFLDAATYDVKGKVSTSPAAAFKYISGSTLKSTSCEKGAPGKTGADGKNGWNNGTLHSPDPGSNGGNGGPAKCNGLDGGAINMVYLSPISLDLSWMDVSGGPGGAGGDGGAGGKGGNGVKSIFSCRPGAGGGNGGNGGTGGTGGNAGSINVYYCSPLIGAKYPGPNAIKGGLGGAGGNSGPGGYGGDSARCPAGQQGYSGSSGLNGTNGNPASPNLIDYRLIDPSKCK